MVWPAVIGAAGAIGAAGLGGFMNRGLSQRDAMSAQNYFSKDYATWSARSLPRQQMQGLKAAGVNPMLPYANGGAPPVQQMTPGIAAPINPGEGLGRAASSAISSAADLYRAESQVKEIEARANLLVRQAITEAEKPAYTRSLTQESMAGTMNKRQQARLSVFQQNLVREDIEVRKRDALIAGIHAGLWKEADDVIKAVLNKLQLSDSVIPQTLGLIDQLRALDKAAQKVIGGAGNAAVQWFKDQF